MKKSSFLLQISILLAFYTMNPLCAQSQTGVALWPEGISENPVSYERETVREAGVNESSPSNRNRVFSQVSEPAYDLYVPEKGKANGAAVVICPGGGFRDVWFDREGSDFALWLKDKGITSLVLKYRTYNSDALRSFLKRDDYFREAYADAKQAIHILRSKSESLDLDPEKIGIAGYSAGGALALLTALEIYEEVLPEYASFNHGTQADFACLIYPGIRDLLVDLVSAKDPIPPVFMINGGEDDVTPAENCIKLYSALRDKGIPTELHIYAKGKHGFDSGIGRGFGIASWQDSFVNWLKDMEFME